MRSLIIYDSQFGNTEKIAKAISGGLTGEVSVQRPGALPPISWSEVNLLVVGSPTQGGRPTVALQKLLDGIPAGALCKTKVAAFDTRFSEKDSNFALRLLMKTIGYAAGKIATALEAQGGRLVVPAEGFTVTGKEGPLKDGELERATAWAKSITIP